MTSFSLRRLWAVLLAATLSAGQAPVPPPAPPQGAARAKEAEATQVSAVVVDVVVRGSDGQPVLDLRADDFEVFEDGVRQELGSFTPIRGPLPPTRSAAVATTQAPEPPAPLASRAPELMAFVFDSMSPEAQGLATQAAMTYVGKAPVTTNVIAVFGIDLSLVLYQPFTRETALVRRALDTIQHRSSVQYGSNLRQQSAAAEQARRNAAQVTAATSSPGGAGQPAPDVAATASGAQFALMQSRSLERFEALERDQQGYATSNALLAIVSAMKSIAGRKSVIFFSEGLSIPPNVQQQFVSVIDAANRANVSIYPMDAAGLRTTSPLAYTREGIEAASAATLARNPTSDVADRPMTEALERNEDLLRADPQSGLGTLADQTGGFLIANSNDLRSGFSRVDSDLRNYYLITYVPQNGRMDGRFRSIDVRVKRRGVRVSSRKGYYAVRPTLTGAPVLAYELPALAALEQTPLPNALPVRATALQFPEAARPGLLPVLVRVPLDAVSFQASPDGRTYTADVAVVVQFKEAAGQVLDKISQRYQLSGPVAAKDRTGRGEILFYREPVLEPGTYSMETVVRDALADKTSVRIQTVTIPTVDATTLRMSTLIAVARSEKVPSSERVPGSPLYVGDQLLYPGFGEPFSKATDKALPFFFVAYTTPGAGDTRAMIELRHGGQRLAQTPLELAPPDDTGRIEQVSRLPLDALAPGRYELHVQVTQGGRSVVRSMPFRVES